jgi:hypothetical protein
MNRLYAAAIILLILASCGKSKTCYKTLGCPLPVYSIVFNGYDTSEIDSVIYSVYTPDSSFSNLLKQKTLSATDSIYSWNDSIIFYKYGSDSIMIQRGYDYKIFIPKTNQTFKIYNYIAGADTTEMFDCRYPGDCAATANITITGGTAYYTSSIHGPGLIFLYKN